MQSSDEARAIAIAQSHRFDDDPVGQYDALVAEFGNTRAESIWIRACILYDANHVFHR